MPYEGIISCWVVQCSFPKNKARFPIHSSPQVLGPCLIFLIKAYEAVIHSTQCKWRAFSSSPCLQKFQLRHRHRKASCCSFTCSIFCPTPGNSIIRLAPSEGNFSVCCILARFFYSIHIKCVLLLLPRPCSWFSLCEVSLQLLQFYPGLCPTNGVFPSVPWTDTLS